MVSSAWETNGRRSLISSKPAEPCTIQKWRGPESNWRHHDFQSCALPTELPRRRSRRWYRATSRRLLVFSGALDGDRVGPVVVDRSRVAPLILVEVDGLAEGERLRTRGQQLRQR